MIRVLHFESEQSDTSYRTALLEGVLEVPKNKGVVDLPVSHFKSLIDRKGRASVIRALTNLQNWFKYKKPSLSKWAIGMKKSLGDYGRQPAR